MKTKINTTDIDFATVRNQMARAFDLSELKTLCFDLNINYQDLPGETLNDKIRELLKYCFRRDRISHLISVLKKTRPNIDWEATIVRQEGEDDRSFDLLEAHSLIKQYNRRYQTLSKEKRIKTENEVSYSLRELAPRLFHKFDVAEWLASANPGKRLTAIVYLNWLQDIEYVPLLLTRVVDEEPFLQLYILITLNSMLDQAGEGLRDSIEAHLTAYTPPHSSTRYAWKTQILSTLLSQKYH
jgi:hypothetical protein